MKIEPLQFDVNGLKLRGNLYLAENPKNLAVLFLHGWTGRPNDAAAKFLASHGYTTMTFSLSGHNDSSGKLEDQTREKSLQEALAAYDLFASRMSKGTKIVAASNSYGGYLSILLSLERHIAGMSLRVPANYTDEKFDELQIGQGGDDSRIMKWREQPLGPSENRALKNLFDFTDPIQIIEAEFDERVPHQTVQNYIDAIQDKSKLDYHLMKGWTHSLGLDSQRNRQYQEILLNWLQQQV
jgi:esterase/lipase